MCAPSDHLMHCAFQCLLEQAHCCCVQSFLLHTCMPHVLSECDPPQGLMPALALRSVPQLDVQQIGGGECLFRGPIGGSVNNALQIAEDGQGAALTFPGANAACAGATSVTQPHG